jgi:uncharacterized protein (DUF2237 family)
MKQCNKCGCSKPISEYYHRKDCKGGPRPDTRCKECVKAKVTERYTKKRESILEKLVVSRTSTDIEDRKKWDRWNSNARSRREARARELKEGKPCVDCGLTFHFAAMDFDHIDPATKGYNANNGISILSLGKKRLEEELPKCELVCANCHRVRTYNRNQERIKEEKDDIRRQDKKA